jgi:hypothetical protein
VRSLPGIAAFADTLSAVDPYFLPDGLASRSLDLVSFLSPVITAKRSVMLLTVRCNHERGTTQATSVCACLPGEKKLEQKRPKL